MRVDVPDLDDLKFVEREWNGRSSLTPVGKRLLEFLKSLGVPMVTPEGWKTPADDE